jgi:hypothetical protein
MMRFAPLLMLAGCADLIGITEERELEIVTLTVSRGTLQPAFDPAIADYDVVVGYADSTVEVHAESNDPQATIEIAGAPSIEGSAAVALPVGDTEVEVVARTPSAVRVTYKVRLHRADLAIAFATPRPVQTTMPGMIDRVAVADFDGNGTDDIGVITGFGDFGMLTNTGAATFAQQPGLFANTKTFGTRDLDADGKPELVMLKDGQLMVARGFGNASFEAPVAWGASKQPFAFAMLQLDADGRTDLVLAEQTGRLAVFQGHAMPSTGFSPMPAFDQNTGSPLTVLATGPIDTQPGDDVASLDPAARRIYVHSNTGVGLGLQIADLGDGAMPAELIAADLDGDERLELIWLDRANDAVVVQNFPGPPRAIHPLPGRPRSLSAIDIDGDGVRDLLVLDDQGVTVLHNDGTGTLTAKAIPIAMPGSVEKLAVGDFNRDGRADFVTCNFTSTIYVHMGIP